MMTEREGPIDQLLTCVGVGSASLLWIGGGLAFGLLSPSESPVRTGGVLIAILGMVASLISLAVAWSILNGRRTKPHKSSPNHASSLDQDSSNPLGAPIEVRVFMLMAPPSCLLVAIGLVVLGISRNIIAGGLLMGAGIAGAVVMAVLMGFGPTLPQKASQRASVFAIVVACLGALSLTAGWLLLDQIPNGVLCLTLMGLGGVGLAISVLLNAWCRSRTESSACGTGAQDESAPPPSSGKWLKGGALVLLLLTGIPFYGWMIAWRYSQRPKAATVGYAELHDSSDKGTVRLVLRPDWRIHYRGRNRAQPHEANIEDQNGQLLFHLYFGRLAKSTSVKDYARQSVEHWQGLEDWQKGGWDFQLGEFRESRNGDIWVERLALRDGKQYGSNIFHHQPVVRTRYVVPWGVDLRIFEFDMPFDLVDEVEPITWRSVLEMPNTPKS